MHGFAQQRIQISQTTSQAAKDPLSSFVTQPQEVTFYRRQMVQTAAPPYGHKKFLTRSWFPSLSSLQ